MIKHKEKAKACIKITGESVFFFISSTTGKGIPLLVEFSRNLTL